MRKEIVLTRVRRPRFFLWPGSCSAKRWAIYEGMNVTQNQSYGVQARGGTSRSEIIVSDEEINYAEIEEPDILLAMSQSALNEYGPKVKENALVIVDSAFVGDVSAVKNTGNIHKIPITEISRERTGQAPFSPTSWALGALARLSGIVAKGSLEREIAARAPEGTERNKSAGLGGGALPKRKNC